MTWLHWSERIKKDVYLFKGSIAVVLVIAGLLVGLLLTVQTSARPAIQRASRTYSSNSTAQMALDLRAEQQELRSQLQQLRTQLSEMQKQAAGSQENLKELQSELEAQKQLIGLTALQGPGVVVTLGDSDRDVAYDDPNLDNYVIHQQQLVLIVGVLWNRGAEALAINDQRIIDQSSIYCVGSTIIVNQAPLSPPFHVQAIGDPVTLAQAIYDSPLLEKLWDRRKETGIVIELEQQETVVVPAYSGNLSTHHMQQVEAQP